MRHCKERRESLEATKTSQRRLQLGNHLSIGRTTMMPHHLQQQGGKRQQQLNQCRRETLTTCAVTNIGNGTLKMDMRSSKVTIGSGIDKKKIGISIGSMVMTHQSQQRHRPTQRKAHGRKIFQGRRTPIFQDRPGSLSMMHGKTTTNARTTIEGQRRSRKEKESTRSSGCSCRYNARE
jgi:hypothetical protein